MNTTVERLIEIEQEREQTQSDPQYQKWVKQLKVSSVYRDKEPIFRAREMMRDYDYSIKIDIGR